MIDQEIEILRPQADREAALKIARDSVMRSLHGQVDDPGFEARAVARIAEWMVDKEGIRTAEDATKLILKTDYRTQSDAPRRGTNLFMRVYERALRDA